MVKRIIVLLSGLLLWASAAFAANSTITGVLQNIDLTPCANCVITLNSSVTQVIGGVTFQPLIKSTTTDVLGNIAPFTMPQGLALQITVSENGQTFAPYTAIVPFLPAVTFDQMNQGILLDPLNVLVTLQPPTGPVNFNGQKITNLACPTVNGDALAWGCNATVNNLTVTGGFTQNTSGAAFFGRFTDSAIADPSAPSSVVAIGVTGATTYYYFLVCNDGNGGQTLVSTGTGVINSNATLSVSNYNQVAFTIPAHALNCDILRNTSNTSVGAQSTTGGLGVTTSPFNDQSNTTAAYVLPTRNTTGDGVFAGQLNANSLDVTNAATIHGIINGGGGMNVSGATIALSATTLTVSRLLDQSTLEVVNGTTLDQGLSVGGTSLLTGAATLAGGVAGPLTLNGATSGSAAIQAAAIAGTPTTLTMPTTNATAGQVLSNNGSGLMSWITLNLASGPFTGILPLANGGTNSASGASSFWMGSSGANNMGTAGFMPVQGANYTVGSQTDVESLAATAGTVSNMQCSVDIAPGANSWIFTLADGLSSTGITCTLTGAGKTCSDLTHSAAIAAGDAMYTSITTVGPPTNTHGRCSYQLRS